MQKAGNHQVKDGVCVFCGKSGVELEQSKICTAALRIEEESRREAAGRVQPASST